MILQHLVVDRERGMITAPPTHQPSVQPSLPLSLIRVLLVRIIMITSGHTLLSISGVPLAHKMRTLLFFLFAIKPLKEKSEDIF